ncbi:uncharacterized protein LOC119084780 [Bradysia coprophila]|uniref:uncharacterized protein LOC119084780 n=1 Tax=Bradysia coprophila TaxID=38358 RepID=UPI00187D8501|nr:uncharacterized protein LOC119084780 [Bradysia coprophila]
MRNTTTRSLRTALAMFLLLLRNNMKQEVIAHNFSTTQQVVSNTIDAVSSALDQHFVPNYLGYYHITREEALEKHSIKLTSKILGQSESRICVVADGTYNYIEKPSDFELQRKTFSLHKCRNLLKPLYIVFPDGYILEAAGPYFCDSKNNDAANIRHHYENSDLLLFLEEGDYFLLDRGYRDVKDETVEKGFSVFMPSLLTGKRINFDCDEANSSRMVTMFRWVVEAVNARIKNVFPFFKHTIEGTYVPKIMRFNRIACAIINAYFEPLTKNKEFHDVIAEVCANDIPQSNQLKDEIEKLGLKRMTTRWEKASATSAVGFPVLSMDDLKRITLGSYQIKIAERYVDSHLREDSQFGIFVHREMDGIIRVRIQSRFSRSKTHDAWVKFRENESGYEAIEGLYCTCKVGERTLGCCSHLTTVLRYLGFDRHQQPKLKARTRCAWDAIDCNVSSDEDSENDS